MSVGTMLQGLSRGTKWGLFAGVMMLFSALSNGSWLVGLAGVSVLAAIGWTRYAAHAKTKAEFQPWPWPADLRAQAEAEHAEHIATRGGIPCLGGAGDHLADHRTRSPRLLDGRRQDPRGAGRDRRCRLAEAGGHQQRPGQKAAGEKVSQGNAADDAGGDRQALPVSALVGYIGGHRLALGKSGNWRQCNNRRKKISFHRSGLAGLDDGGDRLTICLLIWNGLVMLPRFPTPRSDVTGLFPRFSSSARWRSRFRLFSGRLERKKPEGRLGDRVADLPEQRLAIANQPSHPGAAVEPKAHPAHMAVASTGAALWPATPSRSP